MWRGWLIRWSWEIVQDKITSHVQETCKGSFDCNYLASLEEWMDMVVLACLN